jgi:hypothetical protein
MGTDAKDEYRNHSPTDFTLKDDATSPLFLRLTPFSPPLPAYTEQCRNTFS